MTDDSQMQATGDVGDFPEWPTSPPLIHEPVSGIIINIDPQVRDHLLYRDALIAALRARLEMALQAVADMGPDSHMPATAENIIAACTEPKP